MQHELLTALCAAGVVVASLAADFTMSQTNAGGNLDDPSFDFSLIVHGAGWKHCGHVVGGSRSQYAPPVPDGHRTFTLSVEGGATFEGDMRAQVSNGVAVVSYHTVVTKPGRVETVSVQGSVRTDDFGTGRLFFNGIEKPLPGGAKEDRSAYREVGAPNVTRFRIESRNGAKFIDLSFERPVIVSVMRQADPAYLTLRLSAVRQRNLAVGDVQDIAFTLRAHKPVDRKSVV